MKKIFVFVSMLIIATSTFCQRTNPAPALSKQDYLKKSKNQRTTGFIFLAGGVALGATGFVMAISNNSGLFDPNAPEPKYSWTLIDVLGYGGLVLAVASIPFFIASSKNKKKAMSISFKNESAPQLVKSNLVYRSVPSLNLKFSL